MPTCRAWLSLGLAYGGERRLRRAFRDELRQLLQVLRKDVRSRRDVQHHRDVRPLTGHLEDRVLDVLVLSAYLLQLVGLLLLPVIALFQAPAALRCLLELLIGC